MSFPSGLSEQERNRFIGGRRRHNARRQRLAIGRRISIMDMLLDGRSASEIAQILNVSRATIYRDKRWLENKGICRYCGQRWLFFPSEKSKRFLEKYSDMIV